MSSSQEECHIASLVMWVGDGAPALQQRLGELEWADFPMPSEQGKCIAVLEADNDKTLIERIDWMKNLPEVINAQLVYHAFDEVGTDC
jgi:nitrate reductase NapAB chaperone NapD